MVRAAAVEDPGARDLPARYKIKTKAYADDLDVTATGTAGEFDKALSVTQGEFRTKAVPRTTVRPRGRP